MPRRPVGNRNRRRMIALSALLVAVFAAAAPVGAADPARVTLDGEWQLDRSGHDPCYVVVPPVLGGLMHLEADFDRGTVEGWLRGEGSGSYTLPPACDHLNPSEYQLARPTTYQAEFPTVEMTFSGRLDPETGEFEVQGALWVEGSGFHGAPDYQYSCVPGGLTTSCPLFEFPNEQTGVVSGIVRGSGVNQGEIDWLIPYCGAISPTEYGSTDDWSGEGCPTVGQWQADVTEVVWQENEPPQINGIGATPPEATSNDTVVIAVDATDPDDDPLTYTWYVDGVQFPGSGASVTWANPTPGSHAIRVTVSDGAETVETSLDDFQIAEAGDAGDSGGVPGVVPGDPSGDEPAGGETVTSAANPPAGGESSLFNALSGDGGMDEGDEWSPLGIAILILFLILIALAAGLPLQAAVAAVLAGWRPGPTLPTAGETAVLARDVQLGLAEEPPTVTVASPVRPWSSPDTGAPPAEFVLQPGQPYTMLGGEGAGPNEWVQVRQGENVGWVHRSTVQDWHPEVIVRPLPPTAGDYRETVGFFPQGPDVRPPGGANYTRRPSGNYQLGPPDASGHRPVYDSEGTLIGSTPANQVPPSSLRKDVAPPPPPPATP